jgi:hypothetical protein
LKPLPQTLDELDPATVTVADLLKLSHAHRTGQDYPTGEQLIANLPDVLMALGDHVLSGQATALDIAYRLASLIDAIEHRTIARH